MTDPAREVVSDAGPLIHLDELDCPEILSDFSTIWVPDTVRAELETHRPAALARKVVPLLAGRAC